MWDLPGSGTKPESLAWQVDSLPLSHKGSPSGLLNCEEIVVFFEFFLLEYTLLYNVVLVSAARWSESVTCIHISPQEGGGRHVEPRAELPVYTAASH